MHPRFARSVVRASDGRRFLGQAAVATSTAVRGVGDRERGSCRRELTELRLDVGRVDEQCRVRGSNELPVSGKNDTVLPLGEPPDDLISIKVLVARVGRVPPANAKVGDQPATHLIDEDAGRGAIERIHGTPTAVCRRYR